jgi:dihydroorotate dehydrogenase
MRLRGIDFGHVLDASGVRGFFGEGYPYHRWLGPLGPDFAGATFVAKTTTLFATRGNMPLRDDLSPRERKPRCVVVKPWKGAALNAVGLSGPGAAALIADGRWQRRTEPFFLSFMSKEKTADARLEELRCFVALLVAYLPSFQAPLGLQLNFSCPNVGLRQDELAAEIRAALDVAADLGVPLMPKLSVLAPIPVALDAARHPACDALCVSNTVPWGALSDRIDWKGLFGSHVSPLADLGGGGLSGRPLLPLVVEWVREAVAAGVRAPINAGGGILRADDVDELVAAGADSVFIGTMAMLRPWRVRRTIRRATHLLSVVRAQMAHAAKTP